MRPKDGGRGVGRWLACLAGLAACEAPVEVEQLRFACDQNDQCSAGFLCLDGVCGRPRGDGGVAGCNPACTADAICDEATGACVLPGLVCTQAVAVATDQGFDFDLAGQVPRDAHLLGSAVCGADGVRLTTTMAQGGGIFGERAYNYRRFVATLEFAIAPAMPPSSIRGDGVTLVFGPGEPEVGGQGAGLGVIGTTFYFLEVDTFRNGEPNCTEMTEPPTPHVAFSKSTRASVTSQYFCDYPIYAAAPLGPVQDNGFHRLELDVDPGRFGEQVRASLDGRLVLTASVALTPGLAYFGTTGATYVSADTHVIRRLSLVVE